MGLTESTMPGKTLPPLGSRVLLSPQWAAWIVGRVVERVARPVEPTRRAEDVRDPDAYRRRRAAVLASFGRPLVLPYSDHVVQAGEPLDLDHLVPIEAALRSGADDWTPEQWTAFEADVLNLVPARPHVNRVEKRAKGVGAWIPAHHRAWYAHDYAGVKLAHGLTFSADEAVAVRRLLLGSSAP